MTVAVIFIAVAFLTSCELCFSLGYFATRRPASMEDLQFFRDSAANAPKKQDEDSKSISSMQEMLGTNHQPEVVLSRFALPIVFRKSISF